MASRGGGGWNKQTRQGKSPKPKRPKAKLGLPDLDHSKSAVLDSLRSPESKRGYRHAIDESIQWYCSEPRLSFYKIVVTPLPHLPRESAARGGNHQWTTCCSTTTRLRGRRRWLAQSGTRRGYPACERCQEVGREAWELAHGRGKPVASGSRLPRIRSKESRTVRFSPNCWGCGLRRRELADLDFTHPMKEDVKKKILSPPLAGTRAW